MLHKIIIIDDEPEIRNGLNSFFPWHEIGFEVVGTFEDGMRALDYLKLNKVNVVLTDIKMMNISGIKVAEIVHEKYPETIIVFLSGYADFEYAKKAIEYGVKFYIVKPTIYQELFDTFKKIKYEISKKEEKQQIHSLPDGEDNEQTHYEKTINNVKKYIKDNCCNVNLKSAAEYIHMNPYYLSSFFKQHAGVKFIDFVFSIRMQKASEMLMNPIYKINEVSTAIGYQNPNNFGRAFKSYYGVSPRDYRMNYHK